MLSEYSVRERAIRWYAIAKYLNLINKHDIGAYSKANGYMDVLSIPWSKSCGSYSRENIMDYSSKLAKKYVEENNSEDSHDFNIFLDENVNVGFYKEAPYLKEWD